MRRYCRALLKENRHFRDGFRHLCDDIAERSGVMAEKLKAVREDEQTTKKEEQQHEHIRRRS